MNNNRWDMPEYQKMVSVKTDDENLYVLFEDGSWVKVEKDVLFPSLTDQEWNSLEITPYELVIHLKREKIEISWSTIRIITDKEYSKFIAGIADEQAKKIGQRIKELRVKRNLNSKELAERAAITPQSLSRIENGHHDVVFSTLQRLLSAMGFSLKDLIQDEIQNENIQLSKISDKLKVVGIDNDFFYRRIVPASSAKQLKLSKTFPIDDSHIQSVFSSLRNVYGWTIDELVHGDSLTINDSAFQEAMFKTPKKADKKRAKAYAIYAHYIASLMLKCLKTGQLDADQKAVPTDPAIIRNILVEQYGDISFNSLLSYLWDSGISVLPLNDSGAFHGACWNINGQKVIILKQMTLWHSRWLFDLAHELCHVLLHLNSNERFIEPDEIAPIITPSSSVENEANAFANMLVLFGRSEEIVDKCVNYSKGKVEFLKNSLIRVCSEEHVPIDSMANYLAYRLSLQGINWWGTASGLQSDEPNPLLLAREKVLDSSNLRLLESDERKIFQQALKSEE